MFDCLSDDQLYVLEQEPLQNLARDGQFVAYRHDGSFFAMDKYPQFKHLHDLWDSGRALSLVWR